EQDDRADAPHAGGRGGTVPRGESAAEALHPERRAGRLPAQRACHQSRGAGAFQPAARELPAPGGARQLAAAQPALDHPFDLRSSGPAVSLVVEKRGAVGWIVFNQPAKKNAINGAMWRGIAPAMAQFDRDAEVRCVVFRGAGAEAFAAGADISEFESARSDKGAIAEYDDLLDRVLHSIQDSLKPSVAMIHGFCLGGGLEIALACDLRYCGASAQFGI